MIIDLSKVYTHRIVDDILSSHLCLLLLRLLYPCSDTPCFQSCIRIIKSCFIRTSRTLYCFNRIFISLLSHFRAWDIVLEFGFGESSHSTSVFTNRICGSQITWEKTIVAGSPSVVLTSHFGILRHGREHSGNIPFTFGSEIMATGVAVTHLDLALGVALHSRSGLSISSLFFCSPWETDRSRSIFVCFHLRSALILWVLDSPYVGRSNYFS